MPNTYTPDGNYAQTLAYRAMCKEIMGDRPKPRRKVTTPQPDAKPFKCVVSQRRYAKFLATTRRGRRLFARLVMERTNELNARERQTD